MEDKNQQTGTTLSDANPQASVDPFAPTSFDPAALQVGPIAASSYVSGLEARPKKSWLGWSLAAAVMLLISSVIFIVSSAERKTNNGADNALNAASRFDTTVLPLDEINGVIPDIAKNDRATINGTLDIKGGLVLTPSIQPANGQTGQIYYDVNSNTLAYFDGSEFVSLGGQAVESLGGLGGNVSLGAGLSAVGSQLVNAGVLSVQGQTGNVEFSGGNGIVIDGTTIQNTGIVSVISATPSLTVSDDGNGNLTLDLAGGVATVSSPGGTAGRIAKFTSAQTIEDSLLGESGTTVTVNGDLQVTGILNLDSALAVANGGTGANNLTANGVLVGNGTGTISSVTAAGSGLCLMSTAGAPNWASCTGGSGSVTSLNGLTGALTVANASGSGSAITIDDAGTGNKGIASFNSINFDVVGGAVNTVQNIAPTSTPSFAGVNTNTITPSSSLNIGVSTQSLNLLGNASSAFTVGSAGQTTTLGFGGAPSGVVNYNLDRSATPGTYTVCTTAGNCGGGGGAPDDAAYLVATLNGSLTNERALNAGSNISLTDGGAGGNLTVATVQNPTFSTSVTTPLLQSSGTLNLTSAAGEVVAIAAGTTIELQDSTNVAGNLDVSAAISAGTANAFQVNSSGAIAAAAGISSSGTIIFSAFDCTTFANGGTLTTNASGQLSCGDDNGGAANTITGTGTAGAIPVFSGLQTIADSIITQSGTTINIAGELTLDTDLAVASGGTGAGSFTSRGVLYGNGTSALQVTAAPSAGQVLVADNSGVPAFVSISGDIAISDTGSATIQANSVSLGTDTTGNYVTNLGTLTGLSTTGNTGEGSTPTLSVTYGSGSNTAVQGNTTLACPAGSGNLTGGGNSVTLGAGGSCNNISIVNNPTFTTSVSTPLLTLTGAGSNGGLQVANLGQPTTYTLPDPGAAGTTICIATGNCTAVGTAGGDLTGSYPNPTIASLQGTDLSISTPVAGNMLIYNDTNGQWENRAISGDVAISETGVVTIQNNAVSSAKITDGTIVNGDLASGSFANITGVGTLSGLTVVGAANINTSGTANTAIGNSTGSFQLTSSGLNISTGGSLSGVAGITTSGGYTQSGTTSNSLSGATSFTASGTALSVTNNASIGGALTIQGSNALTLGSASTNTGAILFKGSGGTGTLTVSGPASPNTGNFTLSIPAISADANICTDNSVCAGYAPASGSGNYANAALSNLSSVAINTTLLPGTAGTIALGSTTLPFSDFFLSGSSGTPGTNNFRITGTSTSGTRTITLPDATGTVCLQSSSSCGFASSSTAFVQGGNSFSAPAVLGTNDSNSLSFETGGLTQATIAAGGATTFQNSTNSASAFRVLNAAGTSVLTVNTSSPQVEINSPIAGSQGFEGVTFPPASPGTWTTGGNVAWSRSTTVFQEGAASAASGTITHSQSSYLDFDYTFSSSGQLLFYWRVDSETFLDEFYLCVDNDSCTAASSYAAISGNQTWAEVVVPVAAGAHSFRWVYAKDSSGSTGADKAWIDNVRIHEGGILIASSVGTSGSQHFNLIQGGSTKATVNDSSFTLATNIDLILQGPTAEISNTHGFARSEVFGLNASVTDNDAIALGADASAGLGGTAVGYFSEASGIDSVALGDAATATDTYAVALGSFSHAEFRGSIALGVSSTTTAANQLVIGSNTEEISSVRIGNGVTNATPLGFTLQSTSGTGTNIAGASINIAGGQSTGSASGGGINLQVSGTGSSGTSTNGLSTVLSISGSNGAATFQNVSNSTTAFRVLNASSVPQFVIDNSSSSPRVYIGNPTGDGTGALLVLDTKNTSGDPAAGVSVNGSMYYNSVDQKFRCYQNSAWVDCISPREYLRAEMRTIQDTASEVDQDDHVKFANVQASSGSSISLDTSSGYVEGGTGASVGRFTLTAGKTYKLHASIGQRVVVGSSGSIIVYGWYDVTSGALLGSTGSILPSTYAGDDREQSAPAEAVFTPGVTTRVEVRLIDLNGGSINSIGFTSSTYALYPNAFIEVL